MKILLTGASGFIGQYLGKHLAIEHEVLGVTRSDVAHCHSDGVTYIQHDLSVPLTLKQHKTIDAVVHTAAHSPATGDRTSDFILDNVYATKNLVDLSVKSNVKVFVFLSSISVYGKIDCLRVDEDTPIIEPSIYGMTKYLCEELIREEQSFNSLVLRLPVVAGPDMHAGWISKVIVSLLNNEPVHFYNGEARYNMVHVKDLLFLIKHYIQQEEIVGGMYTMSCIDHLTTGQIVRTLRARLKSQSKIIETSKPSKDFIVSSEAISRELHYQPSTGKQILEKVANSLCSMK